MIGEEGWGWGWGRGGSKGWGAGGRGGELAMGYSGDLRGQTNTENQRRNETCVT